MDDRTLEDSELTTLRTFYGDCPEGPVTIEDALKLTPRQLEGIVAVADAKMRLSRRAVALQQVIRATNLAQGAR